MSADSADVVVRAERMVAGGAALAREGSGRVLFVDGALPGELVSARVVRTRRDVAHAVTIEVLEPSADRVEPPCPQVARGCGGCDWQHLSLDAQRDARQSIVVDALRRTGKVPEPVVTLGVPVPASAVRTTVRLAVDAAGAVGFRARRSHDVVTTASCGVAHPLVDDLMALLRVPGADEVTIRVGHATGERGVWWSAPEAAAPIGLPADVRFGADAVVHEEVGGARLRVSPGSFFQASWHAADALVDAVRRAVAPFLADLVPGDTVLDAYAGVGLFAATVVPPTQRVVAVEGSRSSCADAQVNLADRNATIVRVSMERWRPEPAALVIADPSRSGLGREAVDRIVATGATTIVLVSCDPVSLARDVALLRTTGHELLTCEILDLFPHSHHVEAVSVLRRSNDASSRLRPTP